MAEKTAHQLVDSNGKATANATSAPGWFVQDSDDLKVDGYGELGSGSDTSWAPVFSGPMDGNSVRFFTTGEEYFGVVAKAIRSATSSVFIAGWQINYDVEIDGKTTLFECIKEVVDGGKTVYVMPWLSPKAGVDTGDFDTLLAVSLLNAGKSEPLAFCLPAMQQSDQETLGAFFAHHQKLVVIDNKEAYVGGIDLAYGRRDDANCSLKAGSRKLNELYNSCIPPIHKLSNREQVDCVTRAEMLSACLLDGAKGWAATFATSPADLWAPAWDLKDGVSDTVKDGAAVASDWVNNNLVPEFIKSFGNTVQDAVADGAQGVSGWAWDKLDATVRAKLDKLRESGSANAANVATVVLAWLNNADLSRLPPSMTQPVADALKALVIGATIGLATSAQKTSKRYARFFEKIKVVPKSGTVLDTDVQPRIPWHDVQCRVEGPSVYDLARNFVLRWNGIAQAYESAYAQTRNSDVAWVFSLVGLKLPARPKIPRIANAHLPSPDTAKKGSNWVQVLRSAPLCLQKDEAAADKALKSPVRAQNNCLKAMVKAIGSAQKFIYIEGQFFQSAYGKEAVAAGKLSGPMGSMLDIRRSPGYKEYAELLGIKDVPISEIPSKLRWAKVDDVKEKATGPAFMNDLNTVLTSLASVETTKLLGKSKAQERLKNPISLALVNRVRRAINDDLPFHVYLVLPVHPEGALNTLNIMNQVHLTMQSVVFGDHSLVNGIRRAILAARYRKERKMSAAQAKAAANAVDVVELADKVGNEWQQYLTLLNLRNWDMFGKRPVTEQIYVHSKLLIADDRVAVLGSANINDRSMLGDRDSELAVIVTDEAQTTVKLDGVNEDKVATSVHKLRRDLWEKIFGLKSSNRKAPALAAVLDSPAAPATWKAIQQRASRNAEFYEKAFWFIPRSAPRPEIQAKQPDDKERDSPFASLWPTWQYDNYKDHDRGGRLRYRMPFDEWFWHTPGPRDGATNTWNVASDAVKGNAPEQAPEGIEGFIVALPIHWTARETNISGMNLTVLADNLLLKANPGEGLARNSIEESETVEGPA